jgi:hypothetical protein
MADEMTTEEEYPVWNQFRGKLDYAKVGQIRNDRYGRSACLVEPFGSRMGWFNYDALLRHGRAESQGYTVYTPDCWKSDRERAISNFTKNNRFFALAADPKEGEYRRALALPAAGALLKSEIEQAFKIKAKRAHPDAGGSGEEFKQLLAAKDALLKCSGLV